ncbi:MAG: tRNA uridine-5-carboxymethylaminomethyl(34) synthesis GTPase MnmE [Hyphomicrobiales bacterium]|nr:tRNA uridine-5-carboxymethylaminomethyl(34) synthesis GTPase MnmE [Hyphomicrobiales bacterium]
MTDTIFALATGPSISALAVVRVSGPGVPSIMLKCCSKELVPRKATYCRIIDPVTDELVDTGVCIFFPGPQSFTGEDCLEFQIHGSPAVVVRLLRTLGQQSNARPAEPGEFIRRAYVNGKMPLTSVEGVADLLEARTESQRRQALTQAGGHLAGRAAAWRAQLLDALSLLNAEIDFADEGDAPVAVQSAVRSTCQALVQELHLAVSNAARGEQIKNGYRVVIAGLPNAGKSTLMNALVKRDVAIVTAQAGTTRDVIEVNLDLDGFSVVLSDTAGIRDSEDIVEAIGVDRSKKTIAAGNLVLWLADARGGNPELPDSGPPTVRVASKMDLSKSLPSWADVGVSATDETTLGLLVQRIGEHAKSAMAGEPPLVTNERQRFHIEAAARQISTFMGDEGMPIEILADELRRAASSLRSLSGAIGTEDILGAIFSRFCMGK